jgi:hypothetical protein
MFKTAITKVFSSDRRRREFCQNIKQFKRKKRQLRKEKRSFPLIEMSEDKFDTALKLAALGI